MDDGTRKWRSLRGEELVQILKTGKGKLVGDNVIIEGAFEDELKQGTHTIRVEFVSVEREVNLSGINLPNVSIELRNVRFTDMVILDQAQYKQISFLDCVFFKDIVFRKANTGGSILLRNTRLSNIILESAKNLNIALTDISCQRLLINAAVSSLISLGSSQVSIVSILDSTSVSFEAFSSEIQQLDLYKSEVSDFFIVSSHVNEARFRSDFDNCLIEKATINQLEVKALYKGEFIIRKSDIEELAIAEPKFKKILLLHNTINQLILSGDVPKEGQLVIAECKFRGELFFDNVKNYGSINLLDLDFTDTSALKIYHSDLGKTDFINNDLTKARFNFKNSKIAESFLVETDFPQKIYSGEKISYYQAQLAFGQLQTAYQRQGDNIRVSEYQAREIEAHYKTLRWSREKFFTKLNLFFNLISNNFGRNWAQGAAFSILVGLLFFYGLILSSQEFHFALNFSHVPALLDSFLKFMNPLRHFETETLFSDKTPHVTPNAWSYLWDLAGRIFVAYGYYQTIQAFRRFGKK